MAYTILWGFHLSVHSHSLDFLENKAFVKGLVGLFPSFIGFHPSQVFRSRTLQGIYELLGKFVILLLDQIHFAPPKKPWNYDSDSIPLSIPTNNGLPCFQFALRQSSGTHLEPLHGDLRCSYTCESEGVQFLKLDVFGAVFFSIDQVR